MTASEAVLGVEEGVQSELECPIPAPVGAVFCCRKEIPDKVQSLVSQRLDLELYNLTCLQKNTTENDYFVMKNWTRNVRSYGKTEKRG